MIWLVWVYLAMSAATFGVYGWDKFQARRGGWRVKERTLHWLEFAFGWPGAMLAHMALRHKSHKKSFRAWFWAMAVGNVAGVALVLRAMSRFAR